MKKLVSVILVLLMLVSAFCAPFSAYSASKEYAEDVIAEIQKRSGFVPGGTAVVTGNCYLFVSKVCEKLYGVKYDGEGLYGNFRARHQSGNYYTVETYTTESTYPNSQVVEGIISFFIKNATPGDIIHYGAYTTGTSNPSTHTVMIASIDNEKMAIYHSNYQTIEYGRNTCHVDYIYWDSFRKNPTETVKTSDGKKVYSMNSIFYNKMKSSGLGITINRYTNYEDKYYLVGAAIPQLTASAGGSHSVKLSWDEIKGASKYQVQYKKESASVYTTETSDCKSITRTIDNLSIGDNYYFRVRAYVKDKWMSWSDPAIIEVLPPPIVNVTFTKKSAGMNMQWARRTDITGVKIYRSDNKSGDYSLIKTVTDNSVGSYLDKSIEYGKTYYYKFERYLVENGKTYSKTSSAKQTAYELGKPTVTYTNTSASSVKITLTKNGFSDNFKYYLTDANGKKLISDTTTDESINLDALTPCKKYKFYAAESTSVGTGEYASVTFTAVPAKVKELKVSGVTDGLKLSWNKISDAEGYTVYRSDSKDGTYKKLADVKGAQSTTYKDASVKYSTTYYYKVAAYISSSDKQYYGERCGAVSGKNTVGSVKNLKATCKTPTSITLKWDTAKNASGYTVQYKADGGKWTSAGTAKKGSKTISKLKLGKKYYFRVKAYNSIGSGSYTSSVSKKAAVPKPKTPNLKIVSKGIKVYYNNNSYATGYKIYRATSKKGSYKLVKTIDNNTASSWIDTSVSYGKTYYYKVLCFKKSGKKNYTSAKSTGAKKKYSLSVPKLSVKADGTTANLSWNKIEGAEKYTVQYKTSGGSYVSHTVKDTKLQIHNLKQGNTYTFRVKAVSSKGSSSYCTAKSVAF